MQTRVSHRLEPAEAARRLREEAARHEIRSEGEEGALSGIFTKDTPLGSVRARWEARPGEVVVVVEEKPAFLPASTVARALEEGLEKLLAD